MSAKKDFTPAKTTDKNPFKCDKETQTPNVKSKTKASQTYNPSNRKIACQTNEKDFQESEALFKASNKQISEKNELKPFSFGDENLPSKLQTDLEDTTAGKSSCDEASPKELWEQILKTDPLRRIEDSQIYFTQYYDDIYVRIKKLHLMNKTENEFLEINNDYDRIRYILKFKKLMNLNFNIAKYNSKSEEYATALEKEYDNCCHLPDVHTLKHGLELINRSIQFTPGTDSKSLGIRLMKRAWINKMLSKFEEAREDAHRSLQFNFDSSDMWISYEVLGHCYFHIYKNKTADGFFYQALEGLRLSKLDNTIKAEYAKRIISVYKYVKGKIEIEGPDKNVEDLTTPQVSYGFNRTLICATDAVEVKISEETGRGLYATKDIAPGDVIIVEKPYVSVLNRENFETHCNNCFKRFKSSIPCDTCSRVWFCSEECLKEAKDGLHSSECKVLHLLYEKNMGRRAPLVFRILLRLTWENLKLLKQSKKINTRLPDSHPLHTEFDFEDKYSTDDYLPTYKLVTNSRKRNFDYLFKRAFIALYLNHCLKEVDFFKGDKVSLEDEIFVASLILRHLQNSSCNSHSLSEFIVSGRYLGPIPIIYLGVSIHSTTSLLNHSCNPNVFKYSVGKNFVVRAINVIKKGEELFDNYSNMFDTMEREPRRIILKSQYTFHCDCIACEENWPIYDNNKVYMRLACPEEQCDQIVKYDGKDKLKCPSCGFSKKLTNLLKEVNRKLENFDHGINLLKRGQIEEAADVLKKFQMYVSKNFLPPALCLTAYYKFFKRSFYLQGNIFHSNITEG